MAQTGTQPSTPRPSVETELHGPVLSMPGLSPGLSSGLSLPGEGPCPLPPPLPRAVARGSLTLRSSSRSGAELLVSPGPLEGMAGSWAVGGRLGLRGAGGLLGFGEGIIVVFVSKS